MLRRLEDLVLAALQRRCTHPGNMVAVDVLEGDYSSAGLELGYCRRCGALRVCINGRARGWRSPDPNLWAGFARDRRHSNTSPPKGVETGEAYASPAEPTDRAQGSPRQENRGIRAGLGLGREDLVLEDLEAGRAVSLT